MDIKYLKVRHFGLIVLRAALAQITSLPLFALNCILFLTKTGQPNDHIREQTTINRTKTLFFQL